MTQGGRLYVFSRRFRKKTIVVTLLFKKSQHNIHSSLPQRFTEISIWPKFFTTPLNERSSFQKTPRGPRSSLWLCATKKRTEKAIPLRQRLKLQKLFGSNFQLARSRA